MPAAVAACCHRMGAYTPDAFCRMCADKLQVACTGFSRQLAPCGMFLFVLSGRGQEMHSCVLGLAHMLLKRLLRKGSPRCSQRCSASSSRNVSTEEKLRRQWDVVRCFGQEVVWERAALVQGCVACTRQLWEAALGRNASTRAQDRRARVSGLLLRLHASVLLAG